MKKTGLSMCPPLVSALLIGMILACGCATGSTGAAAGGASSEEGETMAERDWEEIDRLVADGRMRAAAEIVQRRLEAARKAGRAEEWARALIRQVQLETALHGYETAVRSLRQSSWPEAPFAEALLELFYAHSLVHYLQVYSWEIAEREKVTSSEELDLRAWTREQILAEANRAFGELWEEREAWGEEEVGRIEEYFEPGNYPERIRGTLRDVVTYLWVEMLANTAFWEPEHSNALFRLDFEGLLEGAPERSEELPLEDPRPHPLVKIGALLDDLEAWHLSEGRPEAAFEARLERIRRLRGSFYGEEEMEAIFEHLQGRLEELGREHPWWSLGMATLAELARDGFALDPLATAHRIAGEGAEAHPESIGGRRCRHIRASIEAPDYALVAMASDGLGQRSVAAVHRNLPRLHFRAYHLDLERAMATPDFRLLPDHRRVEEILARQEPAAEWVLELPPTPDFDSHRTYTTPPLEAKGLYLLAASAEPGFGSDGNQMKATVMLLGDLVLLSRADTSGTEVTVRRGSSGAAVEGAEVRVYLQDWRRPPRLLLERTTGPDGTLRLPELDRRQQAFVIAREGDDLAFDQSLLRFYGGPGRQERTATLIYTDRSVYRPGQEILWKAVLYRAAGESGRLRVESETETKITLHDANGEEVASAKVTSNEFGSASGSFRIPPGRLLGGWSLRSSLSGSAFVRVEEYKRPTFEVSVLDPSEAMRLNRPARLEAEARYYFGLPVGAGKAEWRVVREPVYPRWWHFFGRPRSGSQTVARGTAELASDGRLEIAFTPEADERDAGAPGMSYRYRLSVEVTDEGGETRSGERVFRLGFVAVEAVILREWGFLTPGERGALEVLRRDLDGLPRAGGGRWRLLRLEGPAEALLPAEMPVPPPAAAGEEPYRTPGDLLRPRWETGYSPDEVMRRWDEGREVAAGELRHGDAGTAELRLPELAPGAYRLLYSTDDAFGATFELAEEIVVAAAGGPAPPLPALFLAEERSVPVGGMARLLVASGLAGQPLVLELYRGGERLRRMSFPSASGSRIVEIPVDKELRGGFGARLSMLRDHQLITQTVSVEVPWDDRWLEIELATFRDRLNPGGRETWRVVVRGHDEASLAAGSAELLAYMYDRSLDLFASHNPPRALQLYPVYGSVPALRATLGNAPNLFYHSEDFAPVPKDPRLVPGRLRFLDGVGVGGMGRRQEAFLAEAVVAAEAPMSRAKAQARAPVADEGQAADPEADLALQGRDEAAAAEEPPEPRSDFAETAFWRPHLILGEGGSVAFEFEVPDSVTEWNVWLHALTRDLRAGSLEARARSTKELLVRPYLPRFLRAGDRAEIEVVVNNAGEEPLSGRLDFEILDPATEESLAAEFGLAVEAARGRAFSVEPGGGTSLSFPLRAPNRVGPVAFRVTARADGLSDGELRPLPVLPSRFHLAQSRFAALREGERRELTFADMRREDSTRIDEQLVVALEGQLFYSVLGALPYLVDYPYECTEQILNRFLSTGIVSGLYDEYPAVAAMAETLSARETRLEEFSGEDPNRKMGLEETPWLQQARGGGEAAGTLINVLDRRIAHAQQQASLAALEKAQTALGGFPWWPGGPPSPYMTLYILQGLSRALEFGLEVPEPMVRRAWSYMHRHYLDEIVGRAMEKNVGWPMVTFLAHVLSSYPDPSWTGGLFSEEERRKMLDFSFSHWREHSPLLKGYLALALERAGRHEQAVQVFESVMDSSRTTRDEGTFWAPEERSWLWYNDTIEGHAFALRVLAELDPDDPRQHGLVHWLLLNKKLNHWKSTRATAEVIYALVHYLEREEALAVREEATVEVGPIRRSFVLEPDVYTGGELRLVVPGEELVAATMSTVEVAKEGKGLLFASATWHFSTEELPAEARGDFFSVERRFFRRRHDGREWVLEPLVEGTAVAVGDQLEVQLSLRSRHRAEYVHLRDPRGAGFEPVSLTSGYRWDLGIGWYEEVRDSGTNFFFDHLPVGEYTFKYRLRATTSGTFRIAPATVQPMYAPEFAAYSSGAEVSVEP